jgi:phospholipid transport system substrate-binding protein
LTQIKAVHPPLAYGHHAQQRVANMSCAKSIFFVVGLFLIVTTAASGATTQPDAGKFVGDLANRVLAIFNDPRASHAQKEQQMFGIAVKAFDVPRTARFVLGRFWKDAQPRQREEFTGTFEHYMVHIYTSQFDLYHDVEFKIVSVRPQETRTLVRSRIQRHDGRPPIAVDWWVTRDRDTYRLIDVNIEGVSQLVALREQFASVIDQHDGSVAALIDHLREKTEEVDRLPEKTTE